MIRTAREMFGDSDVFSFENLGIEGQGAQNAIDVTTVGLYLAAAVAALTGLVGLGIALSREVALVDGDQLTLSALGLRTRDRAMAASAVALPVAVGGAVLAFVGAFLASPLFPIGVAREAEPVPGLDLDVFPLAVGALAVLVIVVAFTVVAAARMTRLATRSWEPTRSPPCLERAPRYTFVFPSTLAARETSTRSSCA